MVQKGEEIHVSVRTPDPQFTQSLRQDLGKLGSDLDQAGFRSEAWRPAAVNAVASPVSTNLHHEPSRGGANQDFSRQDANNMDGRAGSGSQEQKRKQQQPDQPRWVAELERQKNS